MRTEEEIKVALNNTKQYYIIARQDIASNALARALGAAWATLAWVLGDDDTPMREILTQEVKARFQKFKDQ